MIDLSAYQQKAKATERLADTARQRAAKRTGTFILSDRGRMDIWARVFRTAGKLTTL